MLQRVAFSMYPVTDAVRARAFYEHTLGLTRGSASANGVWTEYDLPGGGCLALFMHPSGDSQPSDSTGGTIAFEVDDLDALNARLKSAGVTYKADMVHSPVCRMSVIRDSEGNAIILHELKNKPKAEPAKAKAKAKAMAKKSTRAARPAKARKPAKRR